MAPSKNPCTRVRKKSLIPGAPTELAEMSIHLRTTIKLRSKQRRHIAPWSYAQAESRLQRPGTQANDLQNHVTLVTDSPYNKAKPNHCQVFLKKNCQPIRINRIWLFRNPCFLNDDKRPAIQERTCAVKRTLHRIVVFCTQLRASSAFDSY